jgi:hypothetical protein
VAERSTHDELLERGGLYALYSNSPRRLIRLSARWRHLASGGRPDRDGADGPGTSLIQTSSFGNRTAARNHREDPVLVAVVPQATYICCAASIRPVVFRVTSVRRPRPILTREHQPAGHAATAGVGSYTEHADVRLVGLQRAMVVVGPAVELQRD